MNKTFVCIMAGGSGERFWPLSRKNRPKHLLKLFSERTLLEETVRRMEGIVPTENIFILTNASQMEGACEALSFLPPEQIIAEPAKRDTAPAAALATAIARRGGLESTLALLPSDALIKDVPTFQRQFAHGLAYASETGSFVTFAITPNYPATGFGYLELGKADGKGMHEVTRFVEKPDLGRAQGYLQSGNYGWNSGIFIWKVSSFLAEARRLQPTLADFILEFPSTGSYQPYLDQYFMGLPKISIDYAMMERAKRVTALKAEFDWDDVGTWTALPKHLGEDERGNTLQGLVKTLDSENNIVFSSGRMIALCGVSNLVVVETADAILICDKNRVQEVKSLLSILPIELT